MLGREKEKIMFVYISKSKASYARIRIASKMNLWEDTLETITNLSTSARSRARIVAPSQTDIHKKQIPQIPKSQYHSHNKLLAVVLAGVLSCGYPTSSSQYLFILNKCPCLYNSPFCSTLSLRLQRMRHYQYVGADV